MTSDNGASRRGPSRRGVCGGGLALALSAVVPGRAAAGDQAEAGRMLGVDGRRIRRDGLTFRLRGVGIGDPTTARDGRTTDDLRVIRESWHANIVRLSIHPGLYRADPIAMASAIDVNAQAALALGMHVIIDWHAIGWPGGQAEVPKPDWGVPEDFYSCDLDLAARFWREMADRYGSDSRFLFELFTEPVRLDKPVALGAPGEDWAQLRPVWETLLAPLRSRSDNIVIVAGGTWASDLTGVVAAPLASRNVAYAWHVYPWSANGDFATLGRLLGGVPERHPVFVTEWGFSAETPDTAGGEAFGRRFAEEFLERYALNWTAWCYQPGWAPALIEEDWQTPTASGRLVRKLLG